MEQQANDGFKTFDNPDYVKLADYIEAYDGKKFYGLGGYQGYSMDIAFRRDDEEAIQRAHDFGWLKPDSQTIIGSTVLGLAVERGWSKVAEKLRGLGYPEKKG